MATSNNPYRPTDRVSFVRGNGRLTGTIVKTVLARCHILADGKVFVEDYKNVKRERADVGA